MIKQAIAKVMAGRHLEEGEMAASMEEITQGAATPAQMGAFLVGLRLKGESVAELSGAARVLRAKAVTMPGRGPAGGKPLLDVVGTGGDQKGTFNVSTLAALVAAGAGVRVAKHGNRSITSRCGSADLMEALGVCLDLGPEDTGACLERVGLGFFFAPAWHPALGHAQGPRREIGQRTIFNLLGPLINPAGAGRLLLGVCEERLTGLFARVLLRLGAEEAMVVHGLCGCDEISICGPTRVSHLRRGRVEEYSIVPEDAGLTWGCLDDIRAADPAACRDLSLALLRGEKTPQRDMVLLNAAGALLVAGRVPDLKQGADLAAQVLDSGAALEKLESLVAFSAQARLQTGGK